MRRAQFRYLHGTGVRDYPSRAIFVRLKQQRFTFVLMVAVLVTGISLSVPFDKQAKPVDYSVPGENYQICTTQASQYLSSPWTYNALSSGSQQYTVDQYMKLNTNGSENATAPGSAYGNTIPALPSYISSESPSTTAAAIFAPGVSDTATASAAYNFPDSPILYFFEGGSYGNLGLQTISGDEFIGGSANGFPEPVFNDGGGAGGIDAGNDSYNFSGEQTTLSSAASQGATSITIAENPSAYANYVTFSDGTTYRINSNIGGVLQLNASLTSAESQNSAAWTSSSLPIGYVGAGASQGAATVAVANASIPYVQYANVVVGTDTYQISSLTGSESGGYTMGVGTGGLDTAVAANTPIFYTIEAGDVTVAYLNINDDFHNTTGTINMGSGWTVEHNNIHDGYSNSAPGGVALYGGDEGTVEYNCLARMGDYGGGGSGTNENFDYNELLQDANEPDPGCGCSGGGKWWGTLNTNIIDNAFVEVGIGGGQGAVWLDNGNTGADIEGNYFDLVAGSAITNETGFNMLVKNNLFLDDGWENGSGQGSNDDGAVNINSSGGMNIPGSRYENSISVTSNYFINSWQGVGIWQSGLRSCMSSGEGYPIDSAYCSGGFPTTHTTTAGNKYYFSHEGNDLNGGTTRVATNANTGSSTVQVEGNVAMDDQIDIKNPAATTTADTTDVSTFAGSGSITVSSTSGFPSAGQLYVYTSNGSAVLAYTGKTGTSFTGVTLINDPLLSGSGNLSGGIQVNNPLFTTTASTVNVNTFTGTQSLAASSTSGFPATGGELRVGTTDGFSDAGGGYSGAILSYGSISGNTFQNVNLVSGEGTLYGGVGTPAPPAPILQIQPYKVTNETCNANDCTVSITPNLTSSVTAGDEVTNAGTCSLFATSASTPTSPMALSTPAVSYWDGCQWQSKNISVSGNTFVFQQSVIANSAPPIGGGTTTSCNANNNCGINFQSMQVGGSWPPFNDETDGNAMMSSASFTGCPAWDSGCTLDPLANINALPSPPDATVNNGEAPFNDVWSNNAYYGPWTWDAYNFGPCNPLPTDSSSGTSKTLPGSACGNTSYAEWTADWQQDSGSTYTLLPSVPTNLQATPTSQTSVSLSWTASNDNAGPGLGGYYVFRGGSQVGTVNASTTTYSDTGLTPGTQYSYTVEAYDTATPANVSGQSTAATVTTPNGCHYPLYRLRNTHTGEHFYTTDMNEYDAAVAGGSYVPEGIAGYVDLSNLTGDEPLYRLRQISTGTHFYTVSSSEESSLVSSGAYVSEGVAGYVSSSVGNGLSPLYRLRQVSNGMHFYTSSSSEEASLVGSGQYVLEGSAGTVYTANPSTCHVPLYRLRQISTGIHFYTANPSEAFAVEANGSFVPEGISGYVDSTTQAGDEPLYRLRQISTGTHFYTVSSSEESSLVGSGQYANEGTAGYVASSSGGNQSQLYRLRQVSNGIHFYTNSASEESSLVSSSAYASEGNAGYVYNSE